MSNDDVERWVTDELYWDPRLDSSAIAASVDDGKVTLRGTVGSFAEKREAANATRRVAGVESVENALQVRLLDEHLRGDADLRGAVLRALDLNGLVPSSIDARVDDGYVTLTGTAVWIYQRDEAEQVAGNVLGVLGVVDEIELKNPEPRPGDVTKSIGQAFKRNAKLDAEGLTVDTWNGTVSLTGTVGSWAEHDAALATAWAAPGVTNVEDHLRVTY
jgi:osmotically-inducible protein OsmY